MNRYILNLKILLAIVFVILISVSCEKDKEEVVLTNSISLANGAELTGMFEGDIVDLKKINFKLGFDNGTFEEGTLGELSIRYDVDFEILDELHNRIEISSDSVLIIKKEEYYLVGERNGSFVDFIQLLEAKMLEVIKFEMMEPPLKRFYCEGDYTCDLRGLKLRVLLNNQDTVIGDYSIDSDYFGVRFWPEHGESYKNRDSLRIYRETRYDSQTTDKISVKIWVDKVEDIEGNVYKTVRIGEQIWMKEDLISTTYSDGIEIKEVNYGWLNNESKDKAKKYNRGALYKWNVVETKKICPEGWHVPSTAEWDAMELYMARNGHTLDQTFYNGNNPEEARLKIGKCLMYNNYEPLSYKGPRFLGKFYFIKGERRTESYQESTFWWTGNRARYYDDRATCHGVLYSPWSILHSFPVRVSDEPVDSKYPIRCIKTDYNIIYDNF